MGGDRASRTNSELMDLIGSDLKEFSTTAKKLANHALKLGGLGFGTSFFEWVSSFAAIYLLILDRTNWRTNILTSLLVPYIFFSLPSILFSTFRGDIGKWIASVVVVLRLFFPKQFPGWLDIPGSMILLIVVAPSLLASDLRNSWVGLVICLGIAIYLLHQHNRASGGFKKCFTKSRGLSNTVGIVLLLVFPIWALVVELL